jgi:hypothetical protein
MFMDRQKQLVVLPRAWFQCAFMGNEGWGTILLGRVSRHSGLVLFIDILRPANGVMASDLDANLQETNEYST